MSRFSCGIGCFTKKKTNQYFVLKDEQVTGDVRWQLWRDGYEVLWDSARSYQSASKEARECYKLKPLRLETKPITYREACKFINEHHRHHPAPQGHKFSISIHDGEVIVGVIMAGRPVARFQDDGMTLEVTRCCVKEPYKNGISRLYSAVFQVAEAMGYKRIITYTLTEESGISLRASNFSLEKISKGGSWSRSERNRVDKHPIGSKYLWVKQIS